MRVVNNQSTTKVGHTVMLSYINHIFFYHYMHRNKLHTIPTGWTILEKVDVRMMMEALKPIL